MTGFVFDYLVIYKQTLILRNTWSPSLPTSISSSVVPEAGIKGRVEAIIINPTLIHNCSPDLYLTNEWK